MCALREAGRRPSGVVEKATKLIGMLDRTKDAERRFIKVLEKQLADLGGGK